MKINLITALIACIHTIDAEAIYPEIYPYRGSTYRMDAIIDHTPIIEAKYRTLVLWDEMQDLKRAYCYHGANIEDSWMSVLDIEMKLAAIKYPTNIEELRAYVDTEDELSRVTHFFLTEWQEMSLDNSNEFVLDTVDGLKSISRWNQPPGVYEKYLRHDMQSKSYGFRYVHEMDIYSSDMLRQCEDKNAGPLMVDWRKFLIEDEDNVITTLMFPAVYGDLLYRKIDVNLKIYPERYRELYANSRVHEGRLVLYDALWNRICRQFRSSQLGDYEDLVQLTLLLRSIVISVFDRTAFETIVSKDGIWQKLSQDTDVWNQFEHMSQYFMDIRRNVSNYYLNLLEISHRLGVSGETTHAREYFDRGGYHRNIPCYEESCNYQCNNWNEPIPDPRVRQSFLLRHQQSKRYLPVRKPKQLKQPIEENEDLTESQMKRLEEIKEANRNYYEACYQDRLEKIRDQFDKSRDPQNSTKEVKTKKEVRFWDEEKKKARRIPHGQAQITNPGLRNKALQTARNPRPAEHYLQPRPRDSINLANDNVIGDEIRVEKIRSPHKGFLQQGQNPANQSKKPAALQERHVAQQYQRPESEPRVESAQHMFSMSI